MGINRLIAGTQPIILSVGSGSGSVAAFMAGYFNPTTNVTNAGPLYLDLGSLSAGSTPTLFGANDTSAIR